MKMLAFLSAVALTVGMTARAYAYNREESLGREMSKTKSVVVLPLSCVKQVGRLEVAVDQICLVEVAAASEKNAQLANLNETPAECLARCKSRINAAEVLRCSQGCFPTH